jgi:putative ABC transport system ATP-binding protein
MQHRADSLPTRLSGGEQQRVAIARALIHEPKLIVCDEPTSALDAKTGRATMELLRTAAVQPDRAVVVVTHDPRVLPFADRIVTLEDGQVTGEQDPPQHHDHEGH